MSVKMLKLETGHKSWNFPLKGRTLIRGFFMREFELVDKNVDGKYRKR